MQKTIRQLIEKNDTRSSRTFDFLIQIIILIGVVSFALETVPRFIIYAELFKVLKAVVIVCFTIEYILRIYVILKGEPMTIIDEVVGSRQNTKNPED